MQKCRRAEVYRIETPFIHTEKGWPVVISRGIGKLWSVYLVKPTGSLQKCKQFSEWTIPEYAFSELYKNVALKKTFKRKAAA